MGKYDPLRDYLRRQKSDELELSFVEIERKLGYLLPKRASLPEWWARTEPPNRRHVQHQAWGDAGYEAFLMRGEERVCFRRAHVAQAAD